jgi:hypothetical protein
MKSLRVLLALPCAILCVSCAGIGDAWDKLAAEKNKSNTGGTPAKIVFTGPTNIANYGACDGPFTIQAQDATGNPASLSSTVTISLSTTSGSGGLTGFYPTSGCGAAITQITIDAGTSSASVYYRETCTPGAHTLTATSAGLGSTNLSITYGGTGC